MRVWVRICPSRVEAGEVNAVELHRPGVAMEYVSYVHLRDVVFGTDGRITGDPVSRADGWSWHTAPPAGFRAAVRDPWFVDSENLDPVGRSLDAILSGPNVYYSGLSRG